MSTQIARRAVLTRGPSLPGLDVGQKLLDSLLGLCECYNSNHDMYELLVQYEERYDQ